MKTTGVVMQWVRATFAVLAAWAGAAAAADIIPADRTTDWTPGVMVGVPGGIPTDRTRLIDVTKAPYGADNTGATDASPAIKKAIADAKDNDVVYLPAGTYRVNAGISVAGGKSRITIRGDGPDKTIVMGYQPSGSIIGISPGDGGDWWYPTRLKLDITGSPKCGATELTVGDTKGLDEQPNGGIGQLCQISLKDDPKLPVLATARFDYMRRQISRIVKKTATTVTIYPPLLFDLPAELAPVIRPGGRYAEFVGIEDLTVDGTNTATPHGLIGIGTGYACWAKNLKVIRAQSYLFTVDGSLQCEIRKCHISTRKTAAGPNGGGLLFGMNSRCLVEDNIICPGLEVNTCTGNVFAYNFCDDTNVHGGLLASTFNSNHSAHCCFNLYEGNYNFKDKAVPDSESLGGTVLPKSLYLKGKPAWFGELPWPPFGPDTEFEKNKIPAQVRFQGS
jgi:hypothetical protein